MQKKNAYDPSKGEAIVELWNGEHYRQNGFWSQIIIYSLTAQLIFYITVISVKCAQDRIRQYNMDLPNRLLELIPEEEWHLEEQYDEFIDKQECEATKAHPEKMDPIRKAKKKKKKRKIKTVVENNEKTKTLNETQANETLMNEVHTDKTQINEVQINETSVTEMQKTQSVTEEKTSKR